jgi:DNA-binding winged helix-turn-helix (wHTH) protein
MDASTSTARVLRFGIFELDAQSGELRRHGLKIRLPDQAFQILRLLLERPGVVVTREELRQRLWTPDTFVDFDVGVNSAIRKLREALDDSAENPRFVETLPRRGYRFVASVHSAATGQIHESAAGETTTTAAGARPKRIAGVVVVAATIATLILVYALQPQIVREIAGAIGGGRASPPRAAGPRAVNPQAYESYLKGREVGGRQNFDAFRQAVAYFEDAVAKQPDFALAHAAMAQAQLQFLYGGPLSPRETIPKAEAAARRALQLDDTLALAHRMLGNILHHFYWQWDDADKAFARARQLSADPADTLIPVEYLIRNGRFEDAIAAAERARRLDPLSFNASINVAVAYRMAGQHERALSEIRRALEIVPERGRGHFQLGVTLTFMGRSNDAIGELERAVELSHGNLRFGAYLGHAYAAAGRPLDARRILKQLESRARQQYVSSFGMALIHDALGEKEPALTALERAHQDRAVEFAQMAQYPPFTTIASDPRYEAVMRRIGLPR